MGIESGLWPVLLLLVHRSFVAPVPKGKFAPIFALQISHPTTPGLCRVGIKNLSGICIRDEQQLSGQRQPVRAPARCGRRGKAQPYI